jgi:hypothetical protein
MIILTSATTFLMRRADAQARTGYAVGAAVIDVYKLDMWVAGKVRSLESILAVIPGDGLCWSVLSFFGTGNLATGESILEFEERVRRSAVGVPMTWGELRFFAKDLEQTIYCEIIGVEAKGDLEEVASTVDPLSSESCRVLVRAVDSTDWEIGLDPRLDGAAETVARLSRYGE